MQELFLILNEGASTALHVNRNAYPSSVNCSKVLAQTMRPSDFGTSFERPKSLGYQEEEKRQHGRTPVALLHLLKKHRSFPFCIKG